MEPSFLTGQAECCPQFSFPQQMPFAAYIRGGAGLAWSYWQWSWKRVQFFISPLVLFACFMVPTSRSVQSYLRSSPAACSA